MENQNKPAYPVHGIHENLEHFAGLAMQGLLSNENDADTSATYVLAFLGLPENTNYQFSVHYPQYIAKMSTIYAEELLNQLNKTK